MSDQPDGFAQILTEIAGLRGELVGVRTELADRMDRLQDALTAIRNHIGMTICRVDAAFRASPSAREDVRGLEQQVGIMCRQTRRLEDCVREISGDP
jgi:hypothetical protein